MKKPMPSEVSRTAVPSDAAAIPANCDGNRARPDLCPACGHSATWHGAYTCWIGDCDCGLTRCSICDRWWAPGAPGDRNVCTHGDDSRTTAAQLADGTADATEAPPAELLKPEDPSVRALPPEVEEALERLINDARTDGFALSKSTEQRMNAAEAALRSAMADALARSEAREREAVEALREVLTTAPQQPHKDRHPCHWPGLCGKRQHFAFCDKFDEALSRARRVIEEGER